MSGPDGGYVLWLDEPACADPGTAGGKAAGLAGLARAALPVPPAFVVGVPGHRAFLAAAASDTQVPAAVATAIRDAYARLCRISGVNDVAVAVRSSASVEDGAAASYAGQFGTWLDVTGADDVVEHVRRCWTSAADVAGRYTPADGHDHIDMAVVVQRAVRARAAGVMFTLSPVTGDRSIITVEASWGLGLAVVGGEVTPDRWVVDKIGLTVLDRTVADKHIEYRDGHRPSPVPPQRRTQPCLHDDEVVALARLGKRLEREHGCPQDIEFAFDGDDLVLLQRRPETVWSNRSRRPPFPAGQDTTSWISGAVTGRAVTA